MTSKNWIDFKLIHIFRNDFITNETQFDTNVNWTSSEALQQETQKTCVYFPTFRSDIYLNFF